MNPAAYSKEKRKDPMIKSVSLDEASDEQLDSYISNFLQMERSEGEDRRSAILRAQPNTTSIFYLDEEEQQVRNLDDAPAGELDAQQTALVSSLGKGDPKWEINIPIVETEDNSGKLDVLVGVNGRVWQIKRGVDVVVPHRVAMALNDALADIVRHNDEGEVDIRKAKRFPFNYSRKPSDAEIEAWEAAHNDLALA